MRPLIASAAAVTSILAAPFVAGAQPYHHPTTWTSAIYDGTHCPGAGTHYVRTSDLVSTTFSRYDEPDTFLVVDTDNHGTYHVDDCGSHTHSCAWVETDGCMRIIVFASTPSGQGTADVEIDSNVVANDARFSGTLLDLSGLQGAHSYSIHTVHEPTGASRTDLYLFDDNWNLLQYDDEDGAGQQATIYNEYLYSDYQVLVASDAYSTRGYTEVLLNDCQDDPDRAASYDYCEVNWGYDDDKDGIANSLEQDYGPYLSQTNFDTDSDGLSDYYETIGRFKAGEISLASMGAHPGIRDLFLEFDLRSEALQPTESEIALTQESFSDLPQLPPNPFGTREIAIHADIGAPCPNEPELCGDWGGSDINLSYGADYSLSYSSIKQEGYFGEIRQGLFHYAYITGYGTGQAIRPGSSLWVERAGRFVTHELGHNLGLDHWGNPDDPAMNRKAAYPSVMSYAYQNEVSIGFSEGRISSIDHRHIDESCFSPDADKQYFTLDPYELEVDEDRVDFNYDGRIGVPGDVAPSCEQANQRVTFDLSPLVEDTSLHEGITGSAWPELHQRGLLGSSTPTGGTGLVEVTGSSSSATQWAFTPRQTPGGIYVWARKGTVDTSGPSWETNSQALPYFSIHGSGGVAATWFPVTGSAGDIVLLAPDHQGILNSIAFDIDAPDAVESWEPIPFWPTGVAARNASLTVHDGYLVAVFRDVSVSDDVGHVYIAFMTADGGWTIPSRIDGLSSLVTPGVVSAPNKPDDVLYLAAADPAIVSGPIDFYRKDSGMLGSGTGWVEDAALGGINQPNLEDSSIARIALLSVPYLKSNRNPFDDGSEYLALFWLSGDPQQAIGNADEWQLRRAYTTGYFSRSGSTPGPVLGWRGQKQVDRAYPGHSPGLAVHGGNVMAMFTESVWDPAQPDGVTFAPYVTGIPPVDPGGNKDNDDAIFLNANLCRSAWALVYGLGNATCYCNTGNPNVSCSAEPAHIPEEPCDL